MADQNQNAPTAPTGNNNQVPRRPVNRRPYRNDRSGTADKYFKGTTPDIGGIVWTSVETHIEAKVSFTKFKDLLTNYIVKTMPDSTEIINSLTDGSDPVGAFEKKNAALLTGNAPQPGTIADMVLKEEIKSYVARKRNITANVHKLFAIIWGQCTDTLQSVIKLHHEYEKNAANYEGIWLLHRIEENIAGLSKEKNKCVLLREKMMTFNLTRQNENETVHDYLTRFKTNLRSLKLAGGERVIAYELIMGEELEELYQVTSNKSERDVVFAKASDTYAATCFIMRASEVMFGELKKTLAHSMHVGRQQTFTQRQRRRDVSYE